MWNRWKRAIVGRPQSSRAMRPFTTLPDLADVPALPVGDPRGLSAVALAVMSNYLGRNVVQVERMMDSRSAEQEVQQHREPDRQFGAAPHGAAQSAVAPDGVAPDGAAPSGAARWRIAFEDGTDAELGLQMVGAANSEFPALRARYLARQDSIGRDSVTDRLSVDAIDRVGGAPYEIYYRGTVLAARGTCHEAVVIASGLDSSRRRNTMAGLAVLALRLLDE